MSGDLERAAAACILPGFAGLEAPDWLRRRLDDGLGGVVLFARNVRDPEQLAALTAALRADRDDVLVAIDEEGGDVTRLEGERGSSYPGNLALGVVDDVSLTTEVAAAIGSDLAEVGVNLDFAPVADANTNPDNPVIGVRSFGAEPDLAARHVAAFVDGMQRNGVAACAKHFPGHGDTAQDSHLDLPTITGDWDRVLAALMPFRAAIEAGVRAIMTAHIVVPAIDQVPATLSGAILGGLLRDELGFDGLAITDALDMRAISGTVGMEEGAVRALAAGADALCLGSEGDDALVARIHEAIVHAARSGRLSEERLLEAAARVGAEGRRASSPAPDPTARKDVGLEAARRALSVEGDVALDGPALVVEMRPEASIAAGPARHGLGRLLAERVPGTETAVVEAHSAGLDPSLLRDRRVVLVVRDAHRHEWERQMAEALAGSDARAIVVETGIPRWRPAGAAGFVATYGGGRVNFEAAVDALVGASISSGASAEARPSSAGPTAAVPSRD